MFCLVKLTLTVPFQSNVASHEFKNILKYIFKRSMKNLLVVRSNCKVKIFTLVISYIV